MDILRLKKEDLTLMRELNQLFGDVFEEPENYHDHLPDDDYLLSFLGNDNHIVLVAINDGVVVGGLVAYVLRKFEKKRSEVYVYDLAVVEDKRRKGIATKLFKKLEEVAKGYETWTIFVQADKGDDDALGFYRALHTQEEVAHHFDLILHK